jgi:hypothetical protein
VPEDAAAPSLNDIVCHHLLAGGGSNLVYLRLSQILVAECPEPGPTLRAFAEMEPFRLFLTTTFDPLLVRALNAARFGGQPRTTVGAFAPSADDRVADLPARLKDLQGPLVHHLLGQVSPKPDYVVWEKDALEFVCGLQRRLEKLELFPTLWRPLPKLLPSRAQLGGRSCASRTLVQRPPALRRQLFRVARAPQPAKARV